MRQRSLLLSAVMGIALLSLSACGGGDSTAPIDLEFSILDKSNFSSSGIQDKTFAVVKNASDWSALWAQHKISLTPLPAVDFSQRMVVGIFLGLSGGLACDAVDIQAVRQVGRQIQVEYKESSCPPPEGSPGGTAAIVAFPSVIASIPLSPLPVEFVKVE
jgi:hypothetical protein